MRAPYVADAHLLYDEFAVHTHARTHTHTHMHTMTGKFEGWIAFYFISYILIASVMLLNVVIAVLLGKRKST